jgi:CBS domain containing-hemolysin-like protein
MTWMVVTGSSLLILFAAWVRAAGTAITLVPRADAFRDASEGTNGADAVADLLERRESISPAVGVVVSALLVAGAVLATAALVTDAALGGSLLIAASIGLVTFIFGDLVPRRLGRLNPAGIAYRSNWILSRSVRLGGWANELLPDADNGVPDELEDEDEEADEQERELIDSVLEFSETIVREVMTPRPDMVTIPADAPIHELIRVSTDEGFSRFPVTSNGDVVGMVIVKDLLRMFTGDSDKPEVVAEIMRQVEFVPEVKLVSALLAEMQESHTHQVIVVDEYGDVVGLVTIEDLLEELVGEIADETDSDEDMISVEGDGWRVDARLPVDALCKVIGVDVGDDYEGDTVGGLVLGLAERVPEEGEEFGLAPLVMTVIRMQGRRVAEVLVRTTEQAGTM